MTAGPGQNGRQTARSATLRLWQPAAGRSGTGALSVALRAAQTLPMGYAAEWQKREVPRD